MTGENHTTNSSSAKPIRDRQTQNKQRNKLDIIIGEKITTFKSSLDQHGHFH